MLNEREINGLMQATGQFLAGLCFDATDRPVSETLTEENARKVGSQFGMGDKAGGRLVFALACYLLEHHEEDIIARRDDVFASFVGKPTGAVQ